MESVLVTGCAGFIGFHMSKRLLDDGFAVTGLDNLNSYYDVGLKNARLDILKQYGNFTFYRVALEDDGGIGRIFSDSRSRKKIDTVVHLAAQAGAQYSLENPKVCIDSNLTGFFNILEACRQNKISHLIFASSSAVYGLNEAIPFSEHDNTDHPVSLYAATKKANEVMAHSYSHLYGLPVTGLRFFTVYGPWGRPDMALFLFTKAILENRPIKVYNQGKAKRAFTYVDDAIESVARLLDRPPVRNASERMWDATVRNPDPATSSAPYRIYNIGGSKPVVIDGFISILEEKLGRKAVRQYYPVQPGDVPVTSADCGDLEKLIGFKPGTTLDFGIGKFVEWYKTYYNVNA